MKLSRLRTLINRYLQGKASRAERFLVERWYDAFDLNRKKPHWLIDKESRRAFEDDILGRMISRPAAAGRLRPLWWAIAGAAVLAATISIGTYLAMQTGNMDSPRQVVSRSVVTESGQLKRLALPDGTEVFLNANSSVTVDPDFGKKGRTVHLTGEAYFNVERDTVRPFTVVAEGLNVRVLGTSFNVRSYRGLDEIEVTVSHGRVRVADSARAVAEIGKGEALVFVRSTHQYRVRKAQYTGDPAWISGSVVLDRADFKTLKLHVFNVYGLHLESRDGEVLGGTYTLTVRHDRDEDVFLEQLAMLIGKHYRKEADRRVILY